MSDSRARSAADGRSDGTGHYRTGYGACCGLLFNRMAAGGQRKGQGDE